MKFPVPFWQIAILLQKISMLLLTHLLGLWLSSCGNQRLGDQPEASPPEVITETGLRYTILNHGTGPHARDGQLALIHETTKLKNGTVITDTWRMNAPIRFQIGANQVIKGMELAVREMRVGEKRQLVVPPALSQRTSYPDAFGPNDTLYYEVTLLKLEKPPDERDNGYPNQYEKMQACHW